MSKTNNVNDIVKVANSIGDECNEMWEKTKDLKTAQTALNAYKTSISALKTQVVYKKLTGSPSKIDFLE